MLALFRKRRMRSPHITVSAFIGIEARGHPKETSSDPFGATFPRGEGILISVWYFSFANSRRPRPFLFPVPCSLFPSTPRQTPIFPRHYPHFTAFGRFLQPSMSRLSAFIGIVKQSSILRVGIYAIMIVGIMWRYETCDGILALTWARRASAWRS